jgi:membrane protein DedA with SNARE-associated domain
MIEGILDHFTYAGVFVVLLLASLGLPVPEEVPILAGGILAHQQVVRWWIMLPVCIAGALSGDCVLYWMGHRWGEGILEWRAIRRMVTREREEQLKSAYRRQGVKILFAARHVMGFRAAAFLTAGIARLPFWRFLAVDGAAATVGISISFGIAYLFTDHVMEIMGDVHRVERWLGLLALVGVAAWWVISVRRRVRRLP